MVGRMDRYLISSSNNAFALSALTNISKQRIRTSACCLHATDIGISFPASNQAQECINSVSMRVFSVLSLFLLYHTSSLSSLLSLHRIHTNTTTQLTCLARHVSFSLPSFSPSFFVDDLQVFPSSADVCTKHRTGGQIFLVVCPSQPDNLELLHKTFQISSPAHHQDTEGCLCWLAGPCPGASFCRPCRTKRSPLQTCKTKKVGRHTLREQIIWRVLLPNLLVTCQRDYRVSNRTMFSQAVPDFHCLQSPLQRLPETARR